MSLRDKMFSFDGRLRRQDYWLISICLGLSVFAVTEVVMLSVFGRDYSLFTGGFRAGELRAAEGWPFAVQVLISLVTIWPNLAMSAKRAHDRDKSAKVVLSLLAIFWVVTLVPPLVMTTFVMLVTSAGGALAYLGFSLITLALSIYLFVVVGCLDGTQGSNRYGPSPKGVGATEVV